MTGSNDDLPVIERTAVRLVVLDVNSRVLLLHITEQMHKDQASCWELPGGGIDPGESWPMPPGANCSKRPVSRSILDGSGRRPGTAAPPSATPVHGGCRPSSSSRSDCRFPHQRWTMAANQPMRPPHISGSDGGRRPRSRPVRNVFTPVDCPSCCRGSSAANGSESPSSISHEGRSWCGLATRAELKPPNK